MQLIQKIGSAKSSAEIFVKIINRILEREQEKVINGFHKRFSSDYPDFNGWASVYSTQEQLTRLINYVLFNQIDGSVCDNDELPAELQREYNECIKDFILDHPFLHHFERDSEPFVDFTGPAFRDFTLAKLMTDSSGSSDADDYAQCYFADYKHNTRFPSQLYFDLYVFFSNSHGKISHFKYLYDAFKAKERTRSESSVAIEQIDDEMFFVFQQSSSRTSQGKTVVELDAAVNCEALEITQLRNVYIDVAIDIIVGNPDEDVIIENFCIMCKQLIVKSPNIMLIANADQVSLLSCQGKIDSTHSPNVKFDIRTPDDANIKLSIPEIEGSYKLRKYRYELNDARCSM